METLTGEAVRMEVGGDLGTGRLFREKGVVE